MKYNENSNKDELVEGILWRNYNGWQKKQFQFRRILDMNNEYDNKNFFGKLQVEFEHS